MELRKFFSKKDNLFHIIKIDNFEKEEITYNSFESFYEALDKDIADADLIDYDFEGVDLHKYDLSESKISSDIMIKLGIYNDSLFKIITRDAQLSNIIPSASLDSVPSRQLNIEIVNEESFILCYISDLHIINKVVKSFKNNVNEFELYKYLKKIILQLNNSLPKCSHYAIIFAGDISYNFEIFKEFFKIYRQVIPHVETFVILGNHELWDKELNKDCKSIEEIVEKYREFFNSFENKIHLLENQLYLPNGAEILNGQKIYSAEELLAIDNKILRKIILNNGYAIFGGIGYAGKNEEYNASQNIYMSPYITRTQEIERSGKVEALHWKLTEVAADKNIFFVTHMPKECWSTCDYNKNWFYISGHTHKNSYINNEDKKVYADNQVGYMSESFGFKYLSVSNEFDIFQDYKDGIYEIDREAYKFFYYGKTGSHIDFNREYEKLFMIKRKEYYCFLLKAKNSNELKLLQGGLLKNVGKHDCNYFYENLVHYSESIKSILKPYDNFQKQISTEIKRIGGDGRIHGCIIDIDFYNHLYVNPIDASIHAYYASSIEDKYVYNNLISLLKARKIELYNNYKKLLDCNSSDKSLVILNNDLKESKKCKHVTATDMYSYSLRFKGLQYLINNNIVRLWIDAIASGSLQENGKTIFNRLLNPGKTEQDEGQRSIEKKTRNIERKEKKQISKPHLTEEEKKKKLYNAHCDKVLKFNKNIKVISYNGAKEKAEYECLKCGYRWGCRGDRIFYAYQCRCPNCTINY